ncbi:MAG TPA: hypothetical protein VGR02_16145 [Thermoanaerobaculia bacterium]|jgi:hypothetical protein|nr:hypothetical protein [Thermoanaerobaculia bacterium]
MSRINGEKARAAVDRRRRTAQRVKARELKAAIIKKAATQDAPPPKS